MVLLPAPNRSLRAEELVRAFRGDGVILHWVRFHGEWGWRLLNSDTCVKNRLNLSHMIQIRSGASTPECRLDSFRMIRTSGHCARLTIFHKCPMEVSMFAAIHRLIESALELDQAVSHEDRETIPACCRSPAKYREKAKEPEERLLRVTQVMQMLSTSRTTIWRLCKVGSLRSVSLNGSPRFRHSDILALMAGETPRGPTDCPAGARTRGGKA